MAEIFEESAENNTLAFSIEHHLEHKRFEVNVEGLRAILEYMKVGDTLIFTHTEVPEKLEGKGIGGALAKTALEYVTNQNLSAAALCPFVKAYLQRHPEYHSLIRMGG